MGTNAVGAMIVAGPEGFAKNQYRKFNIRTEGIAPGDDFAMMREVMERRFSRLIKEHGGLPDRTPAARRMDEDDDPPAGLARRHPDRRRAGPDQRGTCGAGRTGHSRPGAAVGIAKGADREAGRERFFVEGASPSPCRRAIPCSISCSDLRDEAHRFAIGSHRARRKKEMVKKPARRDCGIGPARKARAAAPFRHGQGRQPCGRGGFVRVEGVSEAMARAIYDHFHPRIDRPRGLVKAGHAGTGGRRCA
jgi:excinuclease ABC subunit C